MRNTAQRNKVDEFYRAIQFGTVADVEQMLSDDFDPTLVLKGYPPILHVAIARGDLQIFELLLKHPKIDVNQLAEDETSPLLYALQQRKFAMAEQLLKNPKTNVNLESETGMDPLHYAVTNEMTNIVPLLVKPPGGQEGANLNKTMNGKTAYEIARQLKLNVIAAQVMPKKNLMQNSVKSMGIQSWFTNRMQRYGYKSDDKGVCYGLSNMFVLAYVLGQRDEGNNLKHLQNFNARLNRIREITLEKLPYVIDKARNKRLALKKQFQESTAQMSASNVYNELRKFDPDVDPNESVDTLRKMLIDAKIDAALSDKDKIDLEIPAFFDDVELMQQGQLYVDFINRPDVTTPSAHHFSPYIISDELRQRGGVSNLMRVSGIYTQNDLESYFQTLQAKLQNLENPISFTFNNIAHISTVGYDPTKKVWTFMEPGLLPREVTDPNELAKLVMDSMSHHAGDKVVTFVTDTYVAKEHRDEFIQPLLDVKSDPNWKALHTPTQARKSMRDSQGNSWRDTMIYFGDEDAYKKFYNKPMPKSQPVLMLSQPEELKLSNAKEVIQNSKPVVFIKKLLHRKSSTPSDTKVEIEFPKGVDPALWQQFSNTKKRIDSLIVHYTDQKDASQKGGNLKRMAVAQLADALKQIELDIRANKLTSYDDIKKRLTPLLTKVKDYSKNAHGRQTHVKLFESILSKVNKDNKVGRNLDKLLHSKTESAAQTILQELNNGVRVTSPGNKK